MVVTFQLVGSRVFCVACSALMPQAAHHIGVRARVGCASPVTPSRVPKASTPQQGAASARCLVFNCLLLVPANSGRRARRGLRVSMASAYTCFCHSARGLSSQERAGCSPATVLSGRRTGGHARGHGLLVLLLLHLSHVGVLLLGEQAGHGVRRRVGVNVGRQLGRARCVIPVSCTACRPCAPAPAPAGLPHTRAAPLATKRAAWCGREPANRPTFPPQALSPFPGSVAHPLPHHRSHLLRLLVALLPLGAQDLAHLAEASARILLHHNLAHVL